MRIPYTGGVARIAPAQLRISWAVFLPISDESSIIIPLDDSALGQFRFLLHGYFFLDSGRRQIEGLNAVVETGMPADAMALRRAWNSELRDSVVLPLLPALLRDALGGAMVTSSELTQLVLALARHDWFRHYREAVCREHALVRVLEGPAIVRRVVPSGGPSGRCRPRWRIPLNGLGNCSEPSAHGPIQTMLTSSSMPARR